MSLSQLWKGCRECPFARTCPNKRMVAYAEAPAAALAHNDVAVPATGPVLRDTVTINMGGDMKVAVYRDELEKQIKRQLYRGLLFPGC